MDWFQNKTTQIIALVSIIGTLAGFGYTGATYVNRLENLEKKVGGIAETKSGLQEIEERFEGIETSIEFINKSIDDTILIEVREGGDSITAIKVDVGSIKASIKSLEGVIEDIQDDIKVLEEDNDNPLLN
tara:strand:+ start:188 stop:577 length:390 start_codon:yes stop_codon:yes gene_type:complete